MSDYPCRRCDRYHPVVCDACDFEPACADHNCWTVAELDAWEDE